MKITYNDKTVGATFTHEDANEIKDVVNENEIIKIRYTYSSEDIIAKTAREIIPAPGVGKYINIVSINVNYTFVTTPYDDTGYIYIGYGTLLNKGSYGSSYISCLNATSSRQVPLTHVNGYTDSNASKENEPFYIKSQNTVAGGDGLVKVIVYYTIEDC